MVVQGSLQTNERPQDSGESFVQGSNKVVKKSIKQEVKYVCEKLVHNRQGGGQVQARTYEGGGSLPL